MIWSERTTVTRDAILELNLVTLIPKSGGSPRYRGYQFCSKKSKDTRGHSSPRDVDAMLSADNKNIITTFIERVLNDRGLEQAYAIVAEDFIELDFLPGQA